MDIIFDLLGLDSKIWFDRRLSFALGGNDEAILYQALITKYIYYQKNNRLTYFDGLPWFYCTADDMYKSVNISKDKQRGIISKLEKLGLIKTMRKKPKNMGSSVRFFHLVLDKTLLEKLLSNVEDFRDYKSENIPQTISNSGKEEIQLSKVKEKVEEKVQEKITEDCNDCNPENNLQTISNTGKEEIQLSKIENPTFESAKIALKSIIYKNNIYKNNTTTTKSETTKDDLEKKENRSSSKQIDKLITLCKQKNLNIPRELLARGINNFGYLYVNDLITNPENYSDNIRNLGAFIIQGLDCKYNKVIKINNVAKMDMPLQFTNFEQREYDKDYFESIYEEL